MRFVNFHSLSKTAVLALLATAISFGIYSCKSDVRAKKMPDSVSAYVYAHTSGIVSKAAPVRIRFVSPVVAADKAGEAADASLLTLSPSAKGVLTWEDPQTLRFDPQGPLSSSTTYAGSVKLNALFDNVPAEAAVFEFDFRTRDQHFEVKIDGLFAANPKELSKQELKGSLFTADVATAEEVEQLLKADQQGKNLSIDWTHTGDGLQHDFLVRGVARGDKDGEMSLSWNGSPIGLSLKGNEKVEVPSLSNFKVTDARVEQGEDQYILLHFSDPLKESQTLDGLVTLANYAGNLRFLIDGQQLRIYPSEKLSGEHRVFVNIGVRNTADRQMKQASEWSVTLEDVKPQVRLVGRGVIMPNSNGLIFPFEAVGLNAVDVEVFKIFNNNILQFLQTNELDQSGYDLYRVGRVVLQRKVSLQSLNPNARTAEWTRYALDLSKMISQDPDAIYQIRIGFRPSYSLYRCSAGNVGAQQEEDALTATDDFPKDEDGELRTIMDYWYGPDGYYEDYQWEQREDPCYSAYYNSERFVQRNVVASNLGIIAKGGNDNSYMVVVADLRTAKPISGADLQFYDFQQQLLTQAKTDANGIASVSMSRKPFVVVAKQGTEKGYLRMGDGNSLSLSRFDVDGQVTQKGLKGFLYGERGVWRPGDSVFLNFILEDRTQRLPANYPISFELYDPRGQLQEKRTVLNQINNVYPLHFATRSDAPTGNWMAKVKAGGANFERTIKVETIKPNRINIQLDFGKEYLSAADEPIKTTLKANWLHGAPAANLRAKVEVQLKPTKTTFPKYGGFVFDDPARRMEETEARTVYDSQLDGNGTAPLKLELLNNQQAPGKVLAAFKTRIFERGGDFSSDNVTVPYHPYNVYAGVDVPQNRYGEKRVDLNKNADLGFVALDVTGKPMSGRSLKVGLYRVEWRWWWDSGYDDVTRYNTGNHYDALETKDVVTNGQGEAKWNINIKEWGRYMVRVCDTESGHCTGDYFYSGYPWFEDDDQNREAAAMINFAADKKKYNVGETVSLTVPTGEAGRVLLTLENGTKVLQSFWKDAKAGDNTITFTATADMAPTIYAHVSLIQPHAQVKNDLPIRLYGVIPVHVEDPATRLAPKIAMPEVLQPEQSVTVEVSEEKGQAMAYTVAIVDEGLLGLTRFKTPNPWDAFYAREALGVRTWDVYDQVLGAYGAELERILSIGGDAELVRGAAKDKVNRFKPVVIHLGPFMLQKGQKARHTVKLPNYVGAVRTMVVAANKGAYGSAEKTTPVRKPLMVLATLPRVLSPGESLKLPVNVFAMEAKVKSATVSVKENSGLVKINGQSSQTLNFSAPGDKMAYFDLQVAEKVGVAKFTVIAEGAGEKASQEITLEVRNPNPYVTEVVSKVLASGETWSPTIKPLGMPGTNKVTLEVSGIPPINLGEHLDYLLQYPYGCLEQTLSGGFPQLYVSKLLELNEDQKQRVPKHIKATIDRLKQFQTSQGGFAYWPGQTGPDQWTTTYAGHFLLEAKALGYTVPPAMLERWIDFQKKSSRLWDPQLREYGYYPEDSYELIQAYRLYTLALAKEADMAGMNRLREHKGLSSAAKWRLAAAYAVAGKPEVAKSIIANVSKTPKPYTELSYTYGSDLRDRAMILETLLLLGDKSNAAEMVKYISEQLSGGNWYSTQTVSFSLLAIGKFVGDSDVSKKVQFVYQINGGQSVNAGSNTPVMQINVPMNGSEKKVMVKNGNGGVLYARVIQRGQPTAGQDKSGANQLDVAVAYFDMQGKTINPTTIAQGTDFVAEVKVTHPGVRGIPYRELALSQIFPSGWEIVNSRMDQLQAFQSGDRPEYRDFRDDRVNTFFDLNEQQTVVYRVQLNAAYQGRYYLPAVSCEAMYDNSIYARKQGMWVEVGAPSEI
ncbi:MAG: hypothetical protein HUU34_01625 [Saprospiraceae bacterium]|nr:hypothetical protein [Saprospiraceae bacterium]